MNRLSTEKRAQIIGCLVEGNSIRATVRMTGAAKNTITKLLVDLGEACAEYQDGVLVDLPCKWSRPTRSGPSATPSRRTCRSSSKGTPGYGDVWTFTALCADTKLVPSWLVGERTIRRRRSLPERPRQSDGEPHPAIAPTATGSTKGPWGRPSPSGRLGADPEDTTPRGRAGQIQPAGLHRDEAPRPQGRPRPRPDLNELRRAPEPHDADGDAPVHAADQRILQEGREPGARGLPALHALQLRPAPQALKERYPRTPAMAAGVTDHIWSLEEIAALLD